MNHVTINQIVQWFFHVDGFSMYGNPSKWTNEIARPVCAVCDKTHSHYVRSASNFVCASCFEQSRLIAESEPVKAARQAEYHQYLERRRKLDREWQMSHESRRSPQMKAIARGGSC